MIILRIDDVGRAPSQPAWGDPDRNLEYFWRWREALGLKGLPVVYGVIPQSVTKDDVQNLHDGLSGGEDVDDLDHLRIDKRSEVLAHQLDVVVDRQFFEPVVFELTQLDFEDAADEFASHRPSPLLVFLLTAEGLIFQTLTARRMNREPDHDICRTDRGPRPLHCELPSHRLDPPIPSSRSIIASSCLADC